jgi:hypothetical protein
LPNRILHEGAALDAVDPLRLPPTLVCLVREFDPQQGDEKHMVNSQSPTPNSQKALD